MTGSELANMYEFSYGAIKRNLEDLSNEESLCWDTSSPLAIQS